MRQLIQTIVIAHVVSILAVATCAAAEAPDFSGGELYRIFCSSCHGKNAHGNGPVAASLKVRPADLTRISRRHGGQFPTEEIRRIVDGQQMIQAHGSRDMPIWGWEFYGVKSEDPARRERSAELIAKLVDYLRSIQR